MPYRRHPKGEPTKLYFGAREYDTATCEIATQALRAQGYTVEVLEGHGPNAIETNAPRTTALWAKTNARAEHDRRAKAAGSV